MVQTAVVLLSGGMDSATALAMTIKEGFGVIGLTLDYGQRHRKEIEAAKRLAKHFRVVDHRIVSIDLTAVGGSALTDRRTPVPERRRLSEMGVGIPTTYVPARNTILLSYALGLAEATGAKAIVIAANAVDYSGYVDCRPEYYAAFREVARLGTKRGVEGDIIEIRTPLIRMSKAETSRRSTSRTRPNGSWTSPAARIPPPKSETSAGPAGSRCFRENRSRARSAAFPSISSTRSRRTERSTWRRSMRSSQRRVRRAESVTCWT